MNEEHKRIYKLASELWGKDAQINMTFEELGEEIQALAHIKRGRGDHISLASEIADVEIMNDQMKLIFNIEDEVKKQKEYKFNRIKHKVEEELKRRQS